MNQIQFGSNKYKSHPWGRPKLVVELPLGISVEVDNSLDLHHLRASRPDSLQDYSFAEYRAKYPASYRARISREYPHMVPKLRSRQILKHTYSKQTARFLRQIAAALASCSRCMPPIPVDNGKPFQVRPLPAAASTISATQTHLYYEKRFNQLEESLTPEGRLTPRSSTKKAASAHQNSELGRLKSLLTTVRYGRNLLRKYKRILARQAALKPDGQIPSEAN